MYPPVIKISVDRPELPPIIKIDGKVFKVEK
jgi:hypothetical protein